MRSRGTSIAVRLSFVVVGVAMCASCNDSSASSSSGAGEQDAGTNGPNASLDGSAPAPIAPSPDDRPAAGNPEGQCVIPDDAQPRDITQPRTVVGTGTKESCTSEAFVQAVAKGGVVTFDCGPAPVTIELQETAKIVNDTGPEIVIDGGNKVTLSGGNKHRILYMNTCDEAQKWTTSNCNDQDHPRLTVQNITLQNGNATGVDPGEDGLRDGGGAIYARGGRLRVVNVHFFDNACDETGPDVGGAAIRAFYQSEGKPLYIVGSTFMGGRCSNGGALSSIGVSYSVLNSYFAKNHAVGNGANPARDGTPGGGSGGAIYNDGNTFTLRLCGTKIEDNDANEGGGAIFFVSNDRSGELVIEDSVLQRNESRGFETEGYPGIFVLAKGDPRVTGSTLK